MTLVLAGRFVQEAVLSQAGSRQVLKVRDLLSGSLRVAKGAPGRSGSPDVLNIEGEYRRLNAARHPRLVGAADLCWASPDLRSPLIPPALGNDSDSQDDDARGSTHRNEDAARAHASIWDSEVLPFRFFTLPYLEGPSLRSLAGKLEPEAVLHWLQDALELVAWLHNCGLSRLDLKSDHFIRVNHRWYLIDLDQAQESNPLEAGGLHGAIAYLAPEVLCGEGTDTRADLYSVGAMLYEALTGSPPPLQGETLEEVREWLPGSPLPPRPVGAGELHHQLAELALALLARAPLQRPASAQEVLDALASALPDTQPRRAPLPPLQPAHLETALAEALARTAQLQRQGGGTLALLAPSGAGSTTLLRRLRQQLELDGNLCLSLEADGVGYAPQGPLETLVRWLELSAQSPEPGRSRAASEVAAPTPLLQLERLRQASSRLLGDRPERAPVLLVDDPALWDRDTWSSLPGLLAHFEDLHLVCVVAGRGAETLARGRGVEVISLPSLSPEAVAACVDRVLGPGILSQTGAQQLTRVTHGLIGPLAQALAERWCDPTRSLEHWTPPGEHAHGQQLLQRIAEQDRPIAQAASVLTEPFDLETLDALVLPREPMKRLSEAVQGLLELGILVRQDRRTDNGLRFSFAREADRRGLTSHLSQDQRNNLHIRLANWLELGSAADIGRLSARIAHHRLAAGQVELARPWLKLAAREAEQQGRYADAVVCLRQELEFSSDKAPHPTLLLQLGKLEQRSGHHAEALAVLEQCLQQEGLPPLVRARCYASLSKVALSLQQRTKARKCMEMALELEPEVAGLQHSERLQWRQVLADLLIRDAEFKAAGGQLQAARELIIPEDSVEVIDQTLYEVRLALHDGGPRAQLDQTLKGAVEQARTLKLPNHTHNALCLLAELCVLEGRLEEAIVYLQQAVLESEAHFDLTREAVARTNLGHQLRELHRESEALPHFERAARIHARLGNKLAEARTRLGMARMLITRQNLSRAEAEMQRGRALMEEASWPDPRVRTWLEILDIQLARKRRRYEGLADQLESLLLRDDPGMETDLWHQALLEHLWLALEQEHVELALDVYARYRSRISTLKVEQRQAIHGALSEAHRRMSGLGVSSLSPPPAPLPGVGAAGEASAGGTPAQSAEFWIDHLRVLIDPSQSEQQLATRLAHFVGQLFGGRGLVVTFGPRTRTGSRDFQVLGAPGIGPVNERDISSNVIERVRSSGEPLICRDIRVDPELSNASSLVAANVCSVVCLPLKARGRTFGALYVDHKAATMALERSLSLLSGVSVLAAEMLDRKPAALTMPGTTGKFTELLGVGEAATRLKQHLALLETYQSKRMVVLFLGPTGAGKTMAARALATAWRPGKPFVEHYGVVNEGMNDGALFGWKKGAFTGAHSDQIGLLESAHEGVLFIDELHNLPLDVQGKLLHFIRTGMLRRVGENVERSVDAHLILATNMEPAELVREKLVRRDLLNSIWANVITVPSLRERGPEDLRILLEDFLVRFSKVSADGLKLERHFDGGALRLLLNHAWPDNIRQLENLCKNVKFIHLLTLGKVLTVEDIGPLLRDLMQEDQVEGGLGAEFVQQLSSQLTYTQIRVVSAEIVSDYLYRIYEVNAYNARKTAKALDCAVGTLYKNCPRIKEPDPESE